MSARYVLMTVSFLLLWFVVGRTSAGEPVEFADLLVEGAGGNPPAQCAGAVAPSGWPGSAVWAWGSVAAATMALATVAGSSPLFTASATTWLAVCRCCA